MVLVYAFLISEDILEDRVREVEHSIVVVFQS